MAGKRGLIMGVANRNSIAWGIARSLSEHGADLAFTFQGEALERRVRPLAEQAGSNMVFPCDVEDSGSIKKVFNMLSSNWVGLDFVVHAIAYSNKQELKGRYVNTTRENFLRTLDVSCYSFTAVTKQAAPLMLAGGSLVSLSFLGAERVMPNYNVMGVAKAALEASVRYLAADLGPKNIRVNAISAGPMRTLAGSAIGGAREILKFSQDASPIERQLNQADLGGAALYLLSDLSRSVTGEVLHVDSGYHAVGMPPFNPQA
ncbi:MAG: enoyl-ACP reductase [Rhodospirillaceae bacterium TMED8]|nr:enoyl-[acyl-carrier-protein] reductase FabI [Magnetovibrio sp.]OUT50552.1 MAG: enoyl-ACP reductase [Rhodospirillaceae bacterium TMED8]